MSFESHIYYIILYIYTVYTILESNNNSEGHTGEISDTQSQSSHTSIYQNSPQVSHRQSIHHNFLLLKKI